MFTVTLHNTDTEEIMGMVAPVNKMDFIPFYDMVRESFTKFHRSPEFSDDYSIEDFVNYHNQNNPVEIDWVLNDFIQLSQTF